MSVYSASCLHCSELRAWPSRPDTACGHLACLGDQWLDEGRLTAARDHAGPAVGIPGAGAWLREQGVLRVVRRAHRLHLDHSQLLRRLEAVVAEPRGVPETWISHVLRHPRF